MKTTDPLYRAIVACLDEGKIDDAYVLITSYTDDADFRPLLARYRFADNQWHIGLIDFEMYTKERSRVIYAFCQLLEDIVEPVIEPKVDIKIRNRVEALAEGVNATNLEETLVELEGLHVQFPLWGRLLSLLGFANALAGFYQKAEMYLERAALFAPEDLVVQQEIYYNLGVVNFQQHNFSQGKEFLMRAAELGSEIAAQWINNFYNQNNYVQ